MFFVFLKQQPRVIVLLSIVFWHCALTSIFLGKGKGRASIVWYYIILIYYANTQYHIESSLAGIAHLYTLNIQFDNTNNEQLPH